MYGWRGPSCNYVAAAMYRTEAAVGNRLNYHSCISTADQWPPNHRDIQPMKIKDMNFGREDFCHGGEKKRSCVSTLKKKYNSLNGQEDMKILALNDFAEGLKDVCPESILFSVDLVKQQTDEVPKSFCTIYNWISRSSANVEDFFLQICFSTCQKKNIKN